MVLPPGGGARAPSMVDVAEQARVSHQTVSRVLNTPDAVRPATREKVERAMRELGYRRNATARALKTRRTGLIGVITPGHSAFGPNRMTLAVEEAAREHGFATALSVVRDSRPETVESSLEFFLDHGVDGIVVLAPIIAVAEAARQIAETRSVVLVASGAEPTASLDVVGIDQVRGAREAVRHLLDAGRRRIAHAAGPGEWYDARGRVQGWQETLSAAGVAEGPLLHCAGWTADDGYAAGAELAPQVASGVVDAVFAANDYIALGMMHAFADHGLSVPEDVAVVGFDDVDGAAHLSPPLTTVRQPFEAVGRAAIAELFGAGGGEHTTLIAPTLIRRATA
ncbi:LacI family DNA-binding transcriptional regulator [Nesterenkonia halophila]|uniref:LacI family DNA-binding transcriptional regulator n=1 Tax=Nesterenkonia halophila TaxID=302044 RepID=UPI001FE31B15|nr:LacI family DNA-binding transcriptional regulator [Nesterenkonia halophila]